MIGGCLHAPMWLKVDFKRSISQLSNVELLLGWMWPLQSWNWIRSATSSVPKERICYRLILKVKGKKMKKKCLVMMVQLQFLVVVLLKLSWRFFSLYTEEMFGSACVYVAASSLKWKNYSMVFCILCPRKMLLKTLWLSQCYLNGIKKADFC